MELKKNNIGISVFCKHNFPQNEKYIEFTKLTENPFNLTLDREERFLAKVVSSSCEVCNMISEVRPD